MLRIKMKLVVFIAVAGAIVNTIKAVKPKQLNLALETVLEFDKKARATDLAVIDKVQDFLDQIKNAMRRSARRSGNRDMTFTDFILKSAKILKNLEDDDLEEAFIIINDETRRHINTESELKQLFDNHDMRRFVSDKLDVIKELSASDLRRHIDSVVTIVQQTSKTGDKNELLDIGNTLYDGSSDKLRRALKKLDELRSTNTFNLENIVKDFFETLVIKHYLDLDTNIKQELVKMARNLWVTFTGNGNDKKETNNRNNEKVTSFRQSKLRNHGHKNKNRPLKQKKESNRFKSTEKYSETDTFENQEIFLSDKKLKDLLRNVNNPTETHTHKDKETNSLMKRVSKKKKSIRSERKEIASSDSEEQILMGGQTIRNRDFRAKTSSVESSLEENRRDDGSSTEEIVIQHSNLIDVGLSRREPGRINITFVSTEHDNNEFKFERRIIRKSNVNDTLQISTNENQSLDLNKMIKRLEEQLQAVKDQVAYVKNLTRAISIDNKAILRFGFKSENATEPETVNETRTFSFRAQYDTDTNSSEMNTNETATNNSTPKTANTTIVNEKKDTSHEENDKKTESHGTGNDNDKHDANEANVDTGDKNKKDVTKKVEHNESTTAKLNLTATNLVGDMSSEHV